MKTWIDRLRREHTLAPEAYRRLLATEDAQAVDYLHRQAREVAHSKFGNDIYIRGLIEVGNRCRNNCLYCGIRAANTLVARYELTKDEILDSCRKGHELGFRTFVLQGGEKQGCYAKWEDVVSTIRRTYPDCAITLSLGEMEREEYEGLFRAGADRYLLRHETYNAAHYRMLHPETMSREDRLKCLQWLKETGYQTGTGIMVGSPGQTFDHLVEDICFIERFRPQMIGIGPFIPQKDTPFRNWPSGSADLTLRLLSIFRLMFPEALIPATTALSTLLLDGKQRGILAGANVVMPNLSPAECRSRYALYDNKAAEGTEAAEGLALLRKQLDRIGYRISTARGDYRSPTHATDEQANRQESSSEDK